MWQAWLTLPSCLASSSRPTLARMIFCSLVMTMFLVNAEAGRCAPRPLRAQPRLVPQPNDTVCQIKSKLLQIIVAFRKHTLLPLDDCLYALQPTIPHLTRSSLYRCLQRHGTARLPNTDGDKPRRAEFKRYPIGFFHIDIAEVRTEQGKLYLFVAIDRTSKFAGACPRT